MDGDGTQAKPYATIAEAYAEVEPYGKITVLPGQYAVDSQLVLSKSGVVLQGRQGAKVVLQAPVIPFLVTGDDSEIRGLEITSDAAYPVEFIQIGADGVLLADNTVYGPPQGGDSSGWVVNRGFVTQGGVTGLKVQGNIFHSLRQPAYFNPSSQAIVLFNTVYDTRGYVVDGAVVQFSGNSWGLPANAVDIALLAGTQSGAPYDPIADLEQNNSAATVSDQR